MQVADFLRLQYPDVMFHSDYGSGVKLTAAQASIQKRQNGGRRAWPDMFIAEQKIYGDICEWVQLKDFAAITRDCSDKIKDFCGGLFLELKKDGEKLHPGPRAKNRFKSKDGKEYVTEHLMEQADCLYDLRERGYCAEFAIGFDEAKKIITAYLGGTNEKQ